jgi:hypothetical protein
MHGAQLRLIVGFSTFLTFFAGHVGGFAQDKVKREKAAREAAVAYAKACNLKTNRAAEAMKIAAVPFFSGGFYRAPTSFDGAAHAYVLERDEDLRKWFDNDRGFKLKFSLEVLRVERYEDFRKKYLEKELALADPDDLQSQQLRDMRVQQLRSARRALDQSIGKDGLIVFLGDEKEISQKKNISQGILIRFEKGSAKVGGDLGVLNPDWVFSAVKPLPEKKK